MTTLLELKMKKADLEDKIKKLHRNCQGNLGLSISLGFRMDLSQINQQLRFAEHKLLVHN